MHDPASWVGLRTVELRQEEIAAMTTRHVRKISRRDTLKRMLGAAAAPMFVPGRLLGADAPSKKITLGFIGMGSQGA